MKDTIVIEGMGDSIPMYVTFNGRTARVVAWSSGSALDDKEKLESFIRKVSEDHFSDPGCAARRLMDKMGWE